MYDVYLIFIIHGFSLSYKFIFIMYTVVLCQCLSRFKVSHYHVSSHYIYYFAICVVEYNLRVVHEERDSGGYGSVGSPVGGPECRSDYDGLQAQCDQAMHQLQLLRHKHSDTIRRFVLNIFKLVFAFSVCV